MCLKNPVVVGGFLSATIAGTNGNQLLATVFPQVERTVINALLGFFLIPMRLIHLFMLTKWVI